MKPNVNKIGLIIILSLIPLTLSDCKKDNEIEDYYVVNISSESAWDYWAVAKDGSSFAIQLQNSVPAYVYYKPVNEHDGYVIKLNEQGIPESTVIDNQIFLFGNYRKDTVDISVVLPNGTIKLFQDISIPYDLTPLLKKGSTNQARDWSEIDYLKWSGKAAGIVACGLGLAATAATGGIALELAIIGCSSTIVGIAADLIDLEVVGLSSDVVGIVTTFVSCTSINAECLLNLYETGMDIRNLVILYESEHQNETDIANGLLTGEITNGLVAYYPFNGNANDESGNNNNGSLNGGASWSSDRFNSDGKALLLDGTTSYVLVPNSSSFPADAITFSYWINRNLSNPTTDQNYISKELAFQSYILTADKMFWSGFCKGTRGIWKNFSSSPYTIANSLGNWIFYAFSYSNSEKIAKTYVNGELVNTYQESDPSVILRKSTYNMYIGRNGSSSVYFVKGKLDDLRIYNRVLSESEIQTLYHEGGWQ